jgi:hypothetical protein
VQKPTFGAGATAGVNFRDSPDYVDIEAYDGKGYDMWFTSVPKQMHDNYTSLPFLRQGGSPYGAVLCEIDISDVYRDQVSRAD